MRPDEVTYDWYRRTTDLSLPLCGDNAGRAAFGMNLTVTRLATNTKLRRGQYNRHPQLVDVGVIVFVDFPL
jgi:hypothetical protein